MQDKKKKKDSPFETIQILKKDRARLMDLAMQISVAKGEGYKSPPSYSHGIVTGIGYDGGRIENHIDPTYYPDTKTVHFNAITQQAEEGGHTIIDGVEYKNVNPTDLLIYQVSELHHEVTSTKGNTPRILWVFGFCLDNEKIEEIFL